MSLPVCSEHPWKRTSVRASMLPVMHCQHKMFPLLHLVPPIRKMAALVRKMLCNHFLVGLIMHTTESICLKVTFVTMVHHDLPLMSAGSGSDRLHWVGYLQKKKPSKASKIFFS